MCVKLDTLIYVFVLLEKRSLAVHEINSTNVILKLKEVNKQDQVGSVE